MQGCFIRVHRGHAFIKLVLESKLVRQIEEQIKWLETALLVQHRIRKNKQKIDLFPL